MKNHSDYHTAEAILCQWDWTSVLDKPTYRLKE